MEISLQILPFKDDCHLITFPMLPTNVNVGLLLLIQIEVLPVIVPPFDGDETVTVVGFENVEHVPFAISTLKSVVWVNISDV